VDVVFLSVEIDAGRVGANAMSNTGSEKFLSYRCKISGGQDWLVILDRGTNATIDQTEIRFAACRGIFTHPSFTIKDFQVSNCGACGIQGRSGWNIVSDNMLQPGPWNFWGRGYQKSFARDKIIAPMMQL